MQENELYSKTNYITDIPLLINANIVEYDISKANISILHSYGVLSDDEYTMFCNMDKETRVVNIGRMMKDDNGQLNNQGVHMTKILSEGIKEAKRQLIEANNIPPENIVRIANDALFINKCPVKYMDFDLNKNGFIISFRPKNVFNIMINLGLVTIFIYDNPMSDDLNVEVKGINDKLLYKHQEFLSFICEVLSTCQRGGKDIALRIFVDFYEQYVNRKLPIGYYREFNSNSMFNIEKCSYLVDIINQEDIDRLNINYNLSLLRILYSAILNTNLG